MHPRAWRRTCAVLLTAFMTLTFLSVLTSSATAVAPTPGTVAAWGYNSTGQTDVPADLTNGTVNVIAVDGGEGHSLALLGDGTVRSWGSQTQADVPVELTDASTARVTAISARGGANLALRYDGTLVSWGTGTVTLPPELSASGTAHVTAISVGPDHNLAVRADGTVLSWGAGPSVPVELTTPATAHVVAVAAGNGHDLALLTDGTVVSWGTNHDGQAVPAGLTNVIAIAEGTYHSVALRADGTVVTWGYNHYGQVPAPGEVTNPATAHVVAIAAGNYHTLALKADGTVIRWGDRSPGSNPVPSPLGHVIGLGAGDWHSLVVHLTDHTAPILGLPSDITGGATGPAGAVVTFTATASDTDPTAPVVTCTPPSGSTFPVGTTTVTCTATDTAGNTATGSFKVTVTSASADVWIHKTAQPGLAQPGDKVTYTLTVHNNGPAKATGVRVTDALPAGTSYVSATGAGCTQAGGTVTCDLGIVPANGTSTVTIKVLVGPVAAATNHTHQLDATKLETHVSLPAGQTQSATATCPSGSFAADGSVRVDHVDQDTGTLADVVVLGSQATGDGRGWIGTIRNGTTGQAQVKVNVVCVSNRTTSGDDHSHPLVLGDWVIARGATAGDTTLACPAGSLAISPSFIYTSGQGVVGTRRTDGGWRFTLHGTGTADLAVRCLSTSLGEVNGHRHDLTFTHLQGVVSVPAGGVAETALTCPVGFKGITAWADPAPGLVPLGNDPQPITRVFRFFNPTDAALDASIGLTCLGIRSWDGQITNTASVTTTSPDPNVGNNADSATFRVTATGIVVAPRALVIARDGVTKVKATLGSTRTRSVRIVLVATSPAPGTDLGTGDVLARGSARLARGNQLVGLTALHRAAGALGDGTIGQAKLVVTATDGTRTVSLVRFAG